MHEASIVEALVKTVCEAAPAGSRIEKIRLVVGLETGYMDSSLRFYFGTLSAGSPAEGAELEISYVRPLLRCTGCGKEFERKRFSFECPSCGGQGVLTKTGSEFYIDSIEVAEGKAEP